MMSLAKKREKEGKNFFNWKLKEHEEFSSEKKAFISQRVEEVDIFVPKCVSVIDLVCVCLLVLCAINQRNLKMRKHDARSN